jgi:hypothetical protein
MPSTRMGIGWKFREKFHQAAALRAEQKVRIAPQFNCFFFFFVFYSFFVGLLFLDIYIYIFVLLFSKSYFQSW